MAEQGRTTLKAYFETGDRPTQAQFEHLIDSGFNVTDDDTDDISEGTNKFVSAAEKSSISTIANKQDKQTTSTTFDDSGDITVASSVEYSTVRTVTGSTHTLTAAASGHVSGNYKLARYTFDVDCDLTLTNFDASGSTVGTVNPIPAGTYNFWFYATAFGVGLVIQNNTGTTPGTLSTPSIVLTALNAGAGYVISAIDANATAGILEFSTDNSNWSTDEDYSFGVNSGTMDGLTNGILYYIRFRVSATGYNPSSYATGTVTPSVVIAPLTAPTASAPTVVSATEVTFTCDDPNTSPQETTVLFRRATNSGMTTNLVTSQAVAGTTTKAWTGLTTDVLYYFDVIHQGNGTTTSDSAASNVVSATPSALVLVEEKIFDSLGTWSKLETGGTVTFVTDEGVTKVRCYGASNGNSEIIYKLNAYTTGHILKITITGIRHVSTNRLYLTIGRTVAAFNFSQPLSSEGTMVFDNINTTTFGTDRAILLGQNPSAGNPATEGFMRSIKIERYI